MRRALQNFTSSSYSPLSRFFATLSEGEQHVLDKLKKSMLKPTAVNVRDTSGGCGAMYQIDVESAAFEGKSVLQQHRLVKDILKEEIKQWHGLSLVTRTAKK